MKIKILFTILIIMGCIIGGKLIHQNLIERSGLKSQKMNIGEGKMEPQDVKIILYKNGEQKSLDNQSQYFLEVLYECERLFKTANDGYEEITPKEDIEEIKKEEAALEIIYPKVVNFSVYGSPTPIKKLVIPLKGECAEGAVFFPNKFSYYGNVLNHQGIGKLKKILKKMKVKID